MIPLSIGIGVTAVLGVSLLFFVRYRRHTPIDFPHAFKNFSPVLSTHRGYGKHGPIAENTLAAFLAAEKRGFRAHELDVRRTSDNKLFLLHGPRLETTTDGRGRIEDTPSEEVRRLNAAHYLASTNPKAKKKSFEPLATLEEVLTKVSKESRINIEIKRDRWDFSRGVEEETLRAVMSSSCADRVFFSGFHFLTLWRLRKFGTRIPVGLLIEKSPVWRLKLFIYRLMLLPDNIHLEYILADDKLLERLKKRGYGLAFWTVDDAKTVDALFAAGAGVVITNNMELITKFQRKKDSGTRKTHRSPSRRT